MKVFSQTATIFVVLIIWISTGYAGTLDFLKDMVTTSPDSAGTAPDTKTTVSGLKEALTVGTQNAVKSVSKTDGFFANDKIKILLPDRIQKVAEVAGTLGYQKQVDDLIVSMNRAAEKAAPKATQLFVQAIKEMTLDDARGILQGGDTAATEFFKQKTSAKLYEAFKPIVSSSMQKVGVARAYKDFMTPVEALPFAPKDNMDLNHYVTNKTLDGLFFMIGEEEKKIRTDPAARVTDLLKTVFGK